MEGSGVDQSAVSGFACLSFALPLCGLCGLRLVFVRQPQINVPSCDSSFLLSALLHFGPSLTFPLSVFRRRSSLSVSSPVRPLPFPSRVHPSISLPLSRHVRRPFLVLSAAFPFQAIQQHCQKASVEREREKEGELKLDGVERPEKKTSGRTDKLANHPCLGLRSSPFVCSAARALVRLRAIKVRV